MPTLMDSKTLKTALKSAVAHIKAEEFTETVKICKKILDAFPKNCQALVFLGVAAEGLGDNTHALQAHKAALDASPNDRLPWQGLCTFYEKHPPDVAEELTQVYEKLLTLSTANEQKQSEIKVKLCKHLLSRDVYLPEISKRVKAFCLELTDSTQRYDVNVALAGNYLKAGTAESKLLLCDVCDEIIKRPLLGDQEVKIWEAYMAILYQTEEDLVKVVKVGNKLLQAYPTSSSLCLVLAEIYCNLKLAELRIADQFGGGVDLINCELLSPSLMQLYNHLSGGQEVDLSAFEPGKLRLSASCCAFLVLTELALKEKSTKKAGSYLVSAEKNLYNLPPCLSQCQQPYKTAMLHLRVRICFKQHNYKEVISLCEQVQGSEFKDEVVISLIETGNFADAEMLLQTDNAGDKVLLGYLNMKKEKLQLAYDCLVDAMAELPKSVNCNLWLGQVCFKMAKQKETLKYLLLAAKLDPQNEQAFLYLGLHYNRFGNSQRGLKCIRKSYSLDPVNDEVCIAYVDLLMAQGDDQQSLDILTQTTKLSTSGSCKWAWLRLGTIRTNEGDYTEAINCFQQALRVDDMDRNCWECLADCYAKRGSYTAAIGAFEKVLERDAGAIYPSYQIALIKYKIGQFEEARQEFHTILTRKPNYTPALKGAGDVHLAIARDAVKQSIYGKAMTNIELALSHLTAAATLRSDLSCVWKSLGDVLTLCYQLPVHLTLQCPSILVSSQRVEDNIATEDISVADALAIGARCYAQCRHLRADNSFIWHDLSVNHLYQSRLSADPDAQRSLLAKASQFALKAISLDKDVVAHYNTLGAIYMEPELFDPIVAQHYLIVAVEIDQSNVQGWTNLAALYLMQGDVKLAHEALKVAQSADPKYNECWTGQAIVAEMIGHNEAMDLFRHTTDLGTNVESVLGYTHWVLETLLKDGDQMSENFRYAIEKLEAVSVSCDWLGRVIDLQPDAQSLNAYALLLERQGLFNMAAKALEKCVSLAENSTDDSIPAYRANFARVLCAKGDLERCLDQLQMISSPTQQDIAVDAIANYKLGRFAEAFQGYSKLSELTEDAEVLSHVHAAMGMMAVKFGDTDIAKTAFFQCSESNSPSIYGLAALCSLALLSGDGELAIAALCELSKCPDSKEAFMLKCMFNSYMAALQGDTKSARNQLLKAIHCYPTNQQLHNQLLTLSVNHLPDYNRDSILRLCRPLSSVQDLVAVALLANGDVKKAFKQAQVAIHLYPDRQPNWSLLLSSAYAVHKLGSISAETVSTLIEYTASHPLSSSSKEELKLWLAEIAALYAAEYSTDEFDTVCQKLSKELKNSGVIPKLQAFRSKNVTVLRSLDIDIFNILLQVGCQEEHSDHIPFLVDLSSTQPSFSPALNILHANSLLQQQQIGLQPSPEDKTAFFSLLEGDNSVSAQLLQAIYYGNVIGNTRFAVKPLEAMVQLDSDTDSLRRPIASAYLKLYSETGSQTLEMN